MEEGLSVMELPLCWVIETLARSGKIDSAILYELLSKAPPLSGKSDKKVREAVAFRCLEELASPSSDHPTPNPSKDIFDASDNCEDVLQLISRENPGIDLRKDASDELKWNIRSFIELKKARLPKCSLELLKNLIVEGTHPIVESLKEIKELELPSQRVVTITSGSVDPTSPSSTAHENGHNSQAMLVEENKDSSKDRIIYQQSLLPTGNSPYSKRGTSSDRVQGADDITHGLNEHDPLVKKRKLDKQDDLQSQKQPSVPCDGDGDGMSSATQDGQNHESPKASQEHNGNSNNENLGDRTKVYAHFDTLPQTSHDIDGHHSRGSEDFARKVLASFSSGSAVPDDSHVMNETEINLCMECNNGGDLLICGSNSCLLAFHESCLGSSASFDDQGKFNCPFCAYSCAISEYVKAKEKVSLAKRKLYLFMGRGTTHKPQPDSARALGDDDNGQRRKVDISKKAEPIISVNNVVTKVANHFKLRSSKNKQKEVSSSTANKAENHSLLTASLLSEINAQLPPDTHRTQDQGKGNHSTDGGNQSNQNENIMNTRQNSSDGERKKETAMRQATEHHEDVNSETISDSDEISEDEKNKTTTSTLSPTPLRQFRPNSQSKRKKVHWTAEEEAMLKEGVQTYGQGGNRVIPWRLILKHGGSVFHEGRTAVDLKDKWRNMQRSPKVN